LREIAIETETETEIAIETAVAIEVVIETEIGFGIVTEIEIASTNPRVYTTPRIMAGIDTALTPTNGAIGMACTQAPTMGGAGKAMTRNVLTSTRAALRADSSPYSRTDRTGWPIATAFCVVIRKAIRTGNGILTVDPIGAEISAKFLAIIGGVR
jgi:hypothetical protein